MFFLHESSVLFFWFFLFLWGFFLCSFFCFFFFSFLRTPKRDPDFTTYKSPSPYHLPVLLRVAEQDILFSCDTPNRMKFYFRLSLLAPPPTPPPHFPPNTNLTLSPGPFCQLSSPQIRPPIDQPSETTPSLVIIASESFFSLFSPLLFFIHTLPFCLGNAMSELWPSRPPRFFFILTRQFSDAALPVVTPPRAISQYDVSLPWPLFFIFPPGVDAFSPPVLYKLRALFSNKFWVVPLSDVYYMCPFIVFLLEAWCKIGRFPV